MMSEYTDLGLKILIILLVSFIIHKTAGYLIDKLVRKLITTDAHLSKEAEEKRENTIIKIFSGTFSVSLWIVVVIMIVSEFGVDVAPLIAGAGIAGVAVGFGGQYLIRDIITGIFIILENQYRVGDIVEIGGRSGVIVDISLRITVLRDLDGILHYVPHGEVKTVSNMSKGFSRININIGVGYGSDIDKVEEIVNGVGDELSEDEKFKDMIVSAPKFLRVEDLGDSAVVIKVLGDVKPGKQWEVSGEFKKRIKIAFDKEGIDIPFPQMVVHESK